MGSHVLLSLLRKPVLFASWKGSMPLSCAQSVGSSGRQPSGCITHTSCSAVCGRTLKACGGVPTRTSKVFQRPSCPSQKVEGVQLQGEGEVEPAVVLAIDWLRVLKHARASCSMSEGSVLLVHVQYDCSLPYRWTWWFGGKQENIASVTNLTRAGQLVSTQATNWKY